MVYILILAISLVFGVLLHAMARRRGCNPILWGSLGASFWFLPLPFLLIYKRRMPEHPGGTTSASGASDRQGHC